MKKIIKENYKLYLISLLVILAFFGMFFIKNNGVAIFDGDTFEQMYKFYCGGWEKVHSGTFSGWDFSMGTGANIFSYSLYWLTSPVFLFCLLFPKEWIPHIILLAVIIQYWLAFIFTHCWMSKLTSNTKAKLIGTFIFVFSGWALAYTRFEWLLISTVFYPLILYFTEEYLEKKKFVALVVSIGLLGIINYYILYQFIPFLFLYTLFRYLIINQKELKLKAILIDALKYTLYVLLGILISCVILLPVAYLVISMPRFSESSVSLFAHYNRYDIYKVLSSLFLPVAKRQNVNLFIDTEYHSFIGWGGGASLYCLIITPLLLPLLLKIKNKFKRNTYLSFLGLLLVFLVFKRFSVLFQATVDTRWFYMFILLNAMIASEVVTDIEDDYIKPKYIIMSCLGTLLIIASCLCYTKFNSLNTAEEMTTLIQECAVMAILIIAYGSILYKKASIKLLLVVLILETTYAGSLFYFNNVPMPYQVFEEKYINNEAVNWIQEHDDSFYRILYGTDYPISSPNQPLADNFMGVSFYSSLYNVNQQEYFDRYIVRCNLMQMITRNNSYNLLSTKYLYFYNKPKYIPEGYELIYSTEDYSIYQNKYYAQLGFTYDKTINETAVSNLNYFDQDNIMQEYLITEDSSNTSYSLTNQSELLTAFGPGYTREFELDEPLDNIQMTVQNFGLPHMTVTTYYQNEIVNTYDYWQYNYATIDITSPIDKVVVEGEQEESDYTMVELYASSLDAYQSNYENLTKNSFTNVSYSNNHIEGDITINNDNQFVFTSISYDPAWKVYANGQRIDYQKVQLGFIGFKLEPGTYHISMSYEVPYLKEGIITSIGGIIILLVLIYLHKHSQKKV